MDNSAALSRRGDRKYCLGRGSYGIKGIITLARRIDTRNWEMSNGVFG